MKTLSIKNLLLSVSLFLFCFSSVLRAQSYLPTDNLEGWWPFNGNAIDESFNGHDGTVNNATLTTDRFDEPGKAYFFNGVNNNITTSFAGILGNDERTVSFWFKCDTAILPNGHIHGHELGMVAWGGSGQNNEGRGFGAVMMDNNQPGLDINTAYKACNYNSLGTWNHYVISFFPSNGPSLESVKLYLNGDLVTDISRTFNILTELNTVNQVSVIFGSTVTAGQYYVGKLDDIGIWSRALSYEEILDLYYGNSIQIIQTPITGTGQGANGILAKLKVQTMGTVNSFNWQVKSGNAFTNISNSNTYLGQGTNTLSITIPADSNFNGRVFHCLISRQNRTDTTSTKKLNERPKLHIFPNPANEQFKISGLEKVEELQLINSLGKEVFLNPTNFNTFSLKSIEKGIYFVRFKNNLGEMQQSKLIVQ
jgi:hypothetical protein